MLDHPRSAIVGVSVIQKFGVDRISSLWDIALFYLYWLEIAYAFGEEGGELGHVSPNDVAHRPNPQKDHPCTEIRRLGHKAWK